jgi:hypothetical protein
VAGSLATWVLRVTLSVSNKGLKGPMFSLKGLILLPRCF